MENLIIVQRPRVQVKFTVRQWELFEDHEHTRTVCQILNSELHRCVNSEIYNKSATRQRMLAVMSANSEVGAYDTEPRVFLERVLDEIFGEDI